LCAGGGIVGMRKLYRYVKNENNIERTWKIRGVPYIGTVVKVTVSTYLVNFLRGGNNIIFGN
jgi:hypothetical protein